MTKSRYYIHGSDNFLIRTYHLHILKAQYHVGDIIQIGRYEHKNYVYDTYRILKLYRYVMLVESTSIHIRESYNYFDLATVYRVKSR
ncbi:hypothetical protein [Blautia sp.]|uniref:hypothetical protein n=1 Tax=Blautia sp. TaxID=1955243 RepID=UPI000E46FC55|nr:hypothetical protein DW799_14895 [Blautia obeum]